MNGSPLSPACTPTGLPPLSNFMQESTLSQGAQQEYGYPRRFFARTALFTAIASSVVGFGVAPAMAAETDTVAHNSNNGSSQANNSAPMSEAQLDTALDALRLKKAVDEGFVDQSVLDDYSNKQNLGSLPKNQPKKSSNSNNKVNTTPSRSSNNNLQQQALNVQQQGYQMMTPAQIERELAAVKASNNNSGKNNNRGFEAPIARLDKRTAPIGFDVSLDAANLPAPTNLETLGFNDGFDASIDARAETTEIVARPSNVNNVSNAATSGWVNASTDITQQTNPMQMFEQQQPAINAVNANMVESPSTPLNPEDYLPNYEPTTDNQDVFDTLEQGVKPTLSELSKSGFIKRIYNRLFNGGYNALPHIKTTVYLQQDVNNAPPKLIKADTDIQPINNIKAALDDTTVQSVVDFTAALPRLRQIALDAAKAVGYYDVTLRLRQPSSDSIDVIIEKLGEPVLVEDRVVDIRGMGGQQAEFQALEKNLPPNKDEIFNHGVYKDSKAALEALSNTYGYFDQYWLNKSVDIILPDNIADISLIYDTGDRYQFDDVVFFTFDKESGTLTKDPAKLPVELSLLRKLYDFKSGDPFYRPDITTFSNDLSATRYFNTVNVETILPPDEQSATSTLAFGNTPIDGNESRAIETDGDMSNNSRIDELSLKEGVQIKDRRLVGNVDNDDTSEDSLKANSNNSNNNSNSNSADASSGARVNAADIAPIDFEVDEETYEKLAAIKQKAERLSRLPTDRVLDEKARKTDSVLGKISDSVSQIAKKLFPDDDLLIADETFVPPELEGRKTPEQVQDTKKVPLYVFVYADKPRDAQVGIGYGTDTGVRATGKIDYNLINRKGYQAGAEVAVSRINKNATVYGSRPLTHPLDDKLEARLSYEEETIDQGEGNFDLSTKTLKAVLARNIHRKESWDSTYFVRYRLDELETGVDEADFEDLPVRFVSSNPKQQALLLGYGISKTTVDNPINPTRGYRQYYGIEAGADKAFSDTDLAIIRAGVSGIYSFGADNKHQVLGSLNTGYIWADDFYNVPYKLRFFAGGDQSIRGYDYNSLSPIDKGYLTGGQILAVGSAEYNYEFKPGFRGAIFSDVGNAYDKDFNADTKVGVGVGIRWASPIGVVRVDVAAGVTEDDIPVRLHFFIGSPL